jgi:hypothetical protein
MLSRKTQDALVVLSAALTACREATLTDDSAWRTAWLSVLAAHDIAVARINAELGEADPAAHFDGKTYDPALDRGRLRRQLGRVFDRLTDGGWHTLSDLASWSRGSEAGVSARLRDLRKRKFGSWIIDDQRLEAGLWGYRMRNPDGSPLPPLKPCSGGFVATGDEE